MPIDNEKDRMDSHEVIRDIIHFWKRNDCVLHVGQKIQ